MLISSILLMTKQKRKGQINMKIEIATTNQTAAQYFHMKGKREYTVEMKRDIMDAPMAA